MPSPALSVLIITTSIPFPVTPPRKLECLDSCYILSQRSATLLSLTFSFMALYLLLSSGFCHLLLALTQSSLNSSLISFPPIFYVACRVSFSISNLIMLLPYSRLHWLLRHHLLSKEQNQGPSSTMI